MREADKENKSVKHNEKTIVLRLVLVYVRSEAEVKFHKIKSGSAASHPAMPSSRYAITPPCHRCSFGITVMARVRVLI